MERIHRYVLIQSRPGFTTMSNMQASLRTVLKVNRIMEIGIENDLPLISLVQSVLKPSLVSSTLT